jgi:hypothetical protein
MFSSGCKVSEEKPYFEHAGQKIFVLYDAPHLLKNVRNNFKRTGFHTVKGQIKWDFVEKLYAFDEQNSLV